jgi:hypothetical protein
MHENLVTADDAAVAPADYAFGWIPFTVQRAHAAGHRYSQRRRSRQKPRFLPATDEVMSEKRPQAVFPID